MHAKPPHATRIVAADLPAREAARLLRDGRLVAFPTETVYGLGANAARRARGRRDFRGQGAAAFQSPESFTFHDRAEADELVTFNRSPPSWCKRSGRPLTLVLKRREPRPWRSWSAPARHLCRAAPRPPICFACADRLPRAFRSPRQRQSRRRVSPTTAADVAEELNGPRSS